MNFSDQQAADFERLKYSGLKVARAWAIKELFSKLWDYCYEGGRPEVLQELVPMGRPKQTQTHHQDGQNDQASS